MTKPTPTQVEPQGTTEMLLAWSDGKGFIIPYVELRFQCPCASCVDEHTGKRVLKREQVAPDVRPLGVQVVGRYALQFNWSDGHSTGMYHFDRLYELCVGAGRPQ